MPTVAQASKRRFYVPCHSCRLLPSSSKTNLNVRKLADGTLNKLHPFGFAVGLTDTETFHLGAAIKQPDKPAFMKAMVKEIENLTNADVWQLKLKSEIVKQKPLKAIWSFKRKRAPDGTYLKHKARLCGHEGMQVEGGHFWNTYSPVVQMTTVRLMLILSLLLNLKSQSIDFTLAYTSSHHVETYTDLPFGFEVENGSKEDYV